MMLVMIQKLNVAEIFLQFTQDYLSNNYIYGQGDCYHHEFDFIFLK